MRESQFPAGSLPGRSRGAPKSFASGSYSNAPSPARCERAKAPGEQPILRRKAVLKAAALMFSAAPKASLEIVPVDGQTFRQLGEINVDLALYSDNPVPPSLRTRDLFRERFGCLLRAGHSAIARSGQSRLRLKDYVAFPHILVTVVGGRTSTVDTALAALGHSRHVAIRIPYFATAALVAASSDLILTIPRRAAENFANDQRLRLLEPPARLVEFRLPDGVA